MALPSSGQISLSQVAVELGRASNATTSLGESAVRSLAGVPSGAISLDNLHGKSAAWSGTITTNQQQLNLRTWALANGWNGSAIATVTINSGVYIWSDDTSVPALTVDGSWAGGLTIVNNGYVMGRGGNGGGVTSGNVIQYGQNGGNAITTTIPITINNTSGYIGGGGGGGGFGSLQPSTDPSILVQYPGAGGAGGGQAGIARLNVSTTPGGAQSPNTYFRYETIPPGSSFSNWYIYSYYFGTSLVYGYASSAGGRVMPGSETQTWTSTTSTVVVLPTTNGGSSPPSFTGVNATQAGGWAMAFISFGTTSKGGSTSNAVAGILNVGGTSYNKSILAGAGGGWGSSGASANKGTGTVYLYAAGSGGKAINTNGNTITWVGGFPSSRVFGAVS